MLVHGLDGLGGQHLMDLRNLPQGVNLQFDPHTGLWLVLSISWSLLLNYIRVFWIIINLDLKDRMYLKHATFFSVVWWGMCLTFCKSNCSWCFTTANYFCTKNFLENLYLLCKALWSSIASVMIFYRNSWMSTLVPEGERTPFSLVVSQKLPNSSNAADGTKRHCWAYRNYSVRHTAFNLA